LRQSYIPWEDDVTILSAVFLNYYYTEVDNVSLLCDFSSCT